MADIITALYDEYGQSLWYDNISRELLDAGEIQRLVDSGIRGLTSNPSIFEKAITSGSAYDQQMRELVAAGEDAAAIYEALAVADIRRAADILYDVYEQSGGTDGFVSLEVSPLLANDTEGTISEAERLFDMVERHNLMIKIPATDAGLPAIETCIANGLNINVTLIFSRAMYGRVINAYLSGLESRDQAGDPVSGIASVASFFVSRVDTLVDNLLDERIAETDDAHLREKMAALKGQAGIANAKLAYQLFKDEFARDLYEGLAEKGAQVQRPLWASTSTKNPAYSDVLYLDNLIGPDTVNTAPPETIEAFKTQGTLANTLEQNVEEAQAVMEALGAVGIQMELVTDQLLAEGIEKFASPYEKLLAAIGAKARTFA